MHSPLGLTGVGEHVHPVFLRDVCQEPLCRIVIVIHGRNIHTESGGEHFRQDDQRARQRARG
jgi:hypothetical protein